MVALAIVGYWTYKERESECDTSMRDPLLSEKMDVEEDTDSLEQASSPVQLEMSNLSLQ